MIVIPGREILASNFASRGAKNSKRQGRIEFDRDPEEDWNFWSVEICIVGSGIPRGLRSLTRVPGIFLIRGGMLTGKEFLSIPPTFFPRYLFRGCLFHLYGPLLFFLFVSSPFSRVLYYYNLQPF